MSFFRSRLNLTLLASFLVQVALMSLGKMPVNEGSLSTMTGNGLALLFRIQDDEQKTANKKRDDETQ